MANIVEYPCPNCNSELNFDSESQTLKCLHCKTNIDIVIGNEDVEEKQIRAYLNASKLGTAELKQITFRCSKCGKDNTATEDAAFFECLYCKNNIINTDAYKSKPITPESIIPFHISREKALGIFQDWIGKGFWNDSALKEHAVNDNMQGCYVPFWTFDSHTESAWSGEAGTYYYVEVNYKDYNGKEKVRREKKTRWHYKSGLTSQFFNDILLSGSKEFDQATIQEIYPFNLNELIPFNPEYLLGWSAKAYDEDMAGLYACFHQYIDAKIHDVCVNLLKEDKYRGLSIQTQYLNETFKHMVLPIWYCHYLFKGKSYFYLINGQTGKIYGKKPLSGSKIVLAILIFIAIIVFFIIIGKQK